MSGLFFIIAQVFYPIFDLKKYISYSFLVFIVLILLASLLIATPIGKRYTSNLLGTLLKETISKVTGPEVEFAFDDLEFDLIEGHLQLSQLELVIQQKEGVNNTLDTATIELIELKVKSLWAVYFTRNLKIEGLRVVHPQVDINLESSAKAPDKKVTMHTADVYSYISKVLNELMVSNFQLLNGNISFQYQDDGYYQTQVINDISITIENFDLSQETRADNQGIFFTENIEIKMVDQVSSLPDSIHLVRFDSLIVSTADEIFQIHGFRVSPELSNHQDENTIDLSFRLLDFSGFDFEKVYQEQIININSIIVNGASIILDNNKPRQRGGGNRDGILSQLNQLFGEIRIDTIGVNNSRMEITTYPNGEMQKEEIEEIDFRIYGLLLNESNKEFNVENRYFDGMELIVENYKAELQAANQRIHYDKIILSSSSNLIRASGVTINPIDTTIKDLGLTYGSVGEVIVTEFDAFTILTKKQAEIGDFVIDNLNLIHIPAQKNEKAEPQLNTSDTKISLDNLYPAISGTLDLLKIRNMYFRDLNIDIKNPKTRQNVVKIKQASVRLSDFLLDSTSYLTDDHLFNAQDVDIEFPSVEIQTNSQKFYVMDLVLQRSNNLISANKIFIDTLLKTQKTQIEAEIDNFYFSGANLREILYHNRYNFDTLYFVNPRIKLHSRNVDAEANTTDDSRIKDILEVFDLKLLGFEKANLEFYQEDSLAGILHEFTFGLVNTRFDPDSLENDRILARYDDFYIEFDSLDWFLPSIEHDLRIKDFSLSLKDSTGSFKDFTLKPTGSNTQNTLNISIPQASAAGIFGHQQSFNRNLDIRMMRFENPDFNITLGPSTDSTTQASGKAFPINTGPFRLLWDTVMIQSIEFADIHTTVAIGDSTQLHIDHIDIKVDNYNVMRGKDMTSDRFLFSDNISVDAAGIFFSNPMTEVNVDSLNLGTSERTLDLNGIRIDQTTESPLDLDIQNIQVSGLNPFRYLTRKEITLEAVAINDPWVHIKPKNGERDTVPKAPLERFAQLSKYPFSAKSVSSVSLDRLRINDLQLTLLDHRNRDSLDLKSFDFTLEGVYMDSSSVIDQNVPFHSKSYSFSAHNTNYPLSPFMRAGIGLLKFSSVDSTLQIRDIRVQPTYSKYEYGVAFGKQTDWVDLSTKSLSIQKLDLPSIFTKKLVHASKLILDSTELSLFRDKNIPFPEDQLRYLPQKYIEDVPYDLLIDTLALNEFDVVYEELPEDGEIAGRFSVNRIKAQVYPITNIPEQVPTDSMMNVEAKGLLMNSGNLSTTMKFNLLDPTYSWMLDASLGPMDLTRLNQMLINTANARIKRGATSSLRQRFNADDTYAEGVMEFYYKNLAVELLNPDHIYEKKGLGKAITTFFANAFVVKSRNPRPFLKRGEIFFIRDHSRSIFNYISKATLSGVITSVGARSNQRAIRDLNREEKKLAQDERKRKKQEKKAERRNSR